MNMDRFAEPENEVIIGYDWEGSEIYQGESFWEVDGEKVLDEPEKILEYWKEHHELKEG